MSKIFYLEPRRRIEQVRQDLKAWQKSEHYRIITKRIARVLQTKHGKLLQLYFTKRLHKAHPQYEEIEARAKQLHNAFLDALIIFVKSLRETEDVAKKL